MYDSPWEEKPHGPGEERASFPNGENSYYGGEGNDAKHP